METGNILEVLKTRWTCIVPCTVVGHTTEELIPVVKTPRGERPNGIELVLTSSLAATPKAGQVPHEVNILSEYVQIGPNDYEEIVGKKITHWNFCQRGGFIIVFDDNAYLKMDLTDSESIPELEMADLDMGDLVLLGILGQDDWDRFIAEKNQVRSAEQRGAGERQLSHAIDTLGIDRVKELISGTTPGN